MKIFLSVSALFAFAIGITFGMHPEWVRIQQFQIDPFENTSEDLLFQRIKTSLTVQLKVFEGKFFWEIPLKGVYELVSRDKRVKKVNIYREFPGRVRMEIEPHTPLLAFLDRDGRIYPVAMDATLLPALSAIDAPDLPILRGEDLKDEPTLRELALELLAAVPDEGLLRKKSVSEILYTRKEGFKIFMSGPASEVKMGDTDFGPKLSRVQKVISYLDSQNIKGRVIDARFNKKVVVRVRKAP